MSRGAGKFAAVAAFAAVALSGCAGSSDDTMGRLLADPMKYTLYSCEEMARQEVGLLARMRTLEGLMQKAGSDAGGRLASAMAYRPEYIAVRGDLNQVRRSMVDKECARPGRPVPAPRR